MNKIKLNNYQDRFLFSESRFPAIVSAIGTGKTFMLLLKVWKYCEQYPDSLALIVRKEFTDLKDSTMKDFEKYFGVTIGSDKNYKMDNGSTILFRHAAEVEVLKNMNLSIIGIEQAEEFESDETFIFLRDRLRRQTGPYRQMCVIANAKGHNWCWRLWVGHNGSAEVLDERTGQIERKNGEFHCLEANTFANEHNLPPDFIADLRRMKEDAPNHYLQYVMNSHEEVDTDDLLFKHDDVYNSPKLVFANQNRSVKRVMGVDVARFGNDKTVFTIIEQKDVYRWEQVFHEKFSKKDTTWVTGYAIDLEKRFNLDLMVIDDTGLGGGVTDGLTSNDSKVIGFIANESASSKYVKEYENSKTEAYFMTADLLGKGWLKLLPEIDQSEQLMTVRFKYKGPRKTIVSKDEMRIKYKELKSPDDASALSMAVWGTDKEASRFGQKQGVAQYGLTDSDMYTGNDNKQLMYGIAD